MTTYVPSRPLVSLLDFGADPTGATSSVTAFNNMCAALAASNGWAGYIPSGLFLFDVAPNLLSSGIIIEGTAGARLKTTMAATGMQTNCIFKAASIAGSKNGTLNTTPTVGSDSISYAVSAGGAPVAGDVFRIGHSLTDQCVTVVSVTGTGPYTLKLDAPIAFPFVSTDTVTQLATVTKGIKIYGNGMTCSGTGDRILEFTSTQCCYVEDLHYDTLLGIVDDCAYSFDVGGSNNIFHNMSANLVGGSAAGKINLSGIYLESQINSRVEESRVYNAVLAGISILDCSGSGIVGSGSYIGTVTQGIGVGTDASLGSFDCYVDDCETVAGVTGLYIGAYRTKISNSSFRYATTYGISQTAGDASQYSNVNCYGSVQGANFSGGTKTKITNLDLSNCGQTVMAVAVDLDVKGFVAQGLSSSGSRVVEITGTPTVRINGFDASCSGGSSAFFHTQSACRLEIDGATANMTGANSIAVWADTGSSYSNIRNVKVSGSTTGTSGVYCTAGTVLVGDGCDLTAAVTAVFSSATVQMQQSAGIFASAITTGTETLNQVRAQVNTIQNSQSLTGNSITNVPAGIPGLQYVAYNSATLNGHTWSIGVTGGTSVVIAAGRTIVVSDGTNMHSVP